MTGFMLFLFIVGIVLSIAAGLATFYHAMQILKIDANTSAVGVGGRDRSKNLRDFIFFAILAPSFALFSFGVAISLDKGGYMFCLSLAVAFMQMIAAPYLGINIVEPPARSADTKPPLRQVS